MKSSCREAQAFLWNINTSCIPLSEQISISVFHDLKPLLPSQKKEKEDSLGLFRFPIWLTALYYYENK
jgi:hypothetical protein